MAITGRVYTASFQNITVSAVQDMITITNSSSRIIALTSLNIGQVTGTSISNQRVRLQRVNSTVVGSGGATVAATPWVLNDAASTATVRANDTTQSTVAGTDLWDDVWNILNGYLWVPPAANRIPVIGPSQSFRFLLDTAPSSVVTNGSVTYEELP